MMPTTVNCKSDDVIGFGLGRTVMGEQREQKWAENAHFLSMTVPDLLLLIRTICGLSVRKSRIHLQSEVLRPSREDFPASFWRMIVLNGELKSMKSILT